MWLYCVMINKHIYQKKRYSIEEWLESGGGIRTGPIEFDVVWFEEKLSRREGLLTLFEPVTL